MKKKILIGINTLTDVNQSIYSNHMELFYRLGRSFKEFDFGVCIPRRMSIDNMRNFTARAAIEGKFEYVWFIDDDVLLPSDSLSHLCNLRSDIAAGITLIRGYPYDPMLFSFKEGRKNNRLVEYKTLVRKDGSIRREDGLDAIGFSCCLIKVALLKKIEAPWFLTGTNFTEDVFFCQRAVEFKKNVTIAASDKIETKHLLGGEFISPANAFAKRAYDERLQPALKRMRNGDPVVTVNSPIAEDFLNGRAVQLAEYYGKPNANKS
jgi:hypothetical protein